MAYADTPAALVDELERRAGGAERIALTTGDGCEPDVWAGVLGAWHARNGRP